MTWGASAWGDKPIGWVPSAGAGSTAYTLAADSAAITLTGTSATLTTIYALLATSEAIALSGTAATITASLTLPATSAAITLAGQDATLMHSTAGSTAYTLTADSAAITIAAQDAVLRGIFVMPAASGDMSIVGQDAVLQASRVMAAESAAVTLAGQSVTLTHNTVGSAVWPAPNQVISGTTYGPTGADYTGTATSGGYPTAADIAAAVRADLSAELARIDAAISSRATVAGILGATVP